MSKAESIHHMVECHWSEKEGHLTQAAASRTLCSAIQASHKRTNDSTYMMVSRAVVLIDWKNGRVRGGSFLGDRLQFGKRRKCGRWAMVMLYCPGKHFRPQSCVL